MLWSLVHFDSLLVLVRNCGHKIRKCQPFWILAGNVTLLVHFWYPYHHMYNVCIIYICYIIISESCDIVVAFCDNMYQWTVCFVTDLFVSVHWQGGSRRHKRCSLWVWLVWALPACSALWSTAARLQAPSLDSLSSWQGPVVCINSICVCVCVCDGNVDIHVYYIIVKFSYIIFGDVPVVELIHV